MASASFESKDNMKVDPHHVIAGIDEAASEIDRDILSKIEVGTLADASVKNDVMSISKAIADCVKLDTANFLTWRSEMLRILGPIHEGRAVGMINGTVKGSLPAFQRYFGIPGTDEDPNDETIKVKQAKLLSIGKASFHRGNEEQQIRMLLLSTMTETAKNGLAQYHEGPVSELWLAIGACYTVDDAMASTTLTGQMWEFDHTGKTMVKIADGLSNLFQEYRLCTGNAVNEKLKLTYLHHAVKKAEKGNAHIINWVSNAKSKLKFVPFSYTFEKAYTELKSLDVDVKGTNVVAQVNPNMFVAQNVAHHDYKSAQMSIQGGEMFNAGGGMFSTAPLPQYPYGNPYSSQGPMKSYGQPMQDMRQVFPRRPDGCWHCGRSGHGISRCRDRDNGRPSIYPNGIPFVGAGVGAAPPRQLQSQPPRPTFQSMPPGQGYSNINVARQPLPPQPSTIQRDQQDDGIAGLHAAMSSMHFEANQANDNLA